ncbi:MAG: rim15, signal transduction response regulator [Vezdaea aestivalis]|nr:MAG: rim15, signal transduction response regulator [Vezdaea aestivalis]
MARPTPDDGIVLPAPAVSQLKEEDAPDSQSRGKMERTFSTDIREETEDLKEAAEQTSNIVLDLGLDGKIRWVSPSWREVIGTEPDTVKGTAIADLLVEDQDAFTGAVESMKKDDSKSHTIRFSVQIGPGSRFANETTASPVEAREQTALDGEQPATETSIIMLEGQGIMVYDRSSGGESHSMWMIHPYVPREITIDLPQVLIESLGFGAEVLANYLTSLAEFGANDPANHAPPMPVLCRICERQIPPWWFEKHTELCLQEHRAEMDISNAQDALTEHRNAIVKVLDALEARNSRPTSIDAAPATVIQPEYKGLPIGPASNPSTGPSSGTASPGTSFSRSRESSSNGLGHARHRSFAVRRPLTRIVELLLDLCDTTMEISTPAIKEMPDTNGDQFRTQSPLSENRVSQVLHWQSPSTNTLENEQGLAALCADTESNARTKVEAVLRHRRIIEYSERIRCEFSIIVQDCIEDAIRKARRIAAGEPSSSEDEHMEDAQEHLDPEAPSTEESFPSGQEHQPARQESQEGVFLGSFEGPTSLATALRKASDPALARLDRRQSSAATSTRSSSPRECPTPRSHRGAISILGQSHHYKRSSMHFESDAGDSDSSLPSSLVSGIRRTESPASEIALSRAASSRDRHRRSLILPDTSSPRRQASPGRSNGPPSPLRITKPRFPNVQDATNSPITSPQLGANDLTSSAVHSYHHRRQSSATSSDWRLHHPPSPRLSSVSQPQARAVQTSIKDFDIIKPISKGAFGSVYLSKKKSTGDYYAIKVLKKADMVSKNQVTNVKAERAIMMWQGQSDFVAKLYWTFSSKDNLYLVMEYLNGGDCASLIKVLGGLPEDWARKYLAEVVLGVEHLHDRGIVHRDLKPDNLLIDQKGHLKLTDFGLSRMGLIGRQKRALNNDQEPPPDLLKSNNFRRSISLASSRSASFDFHHGNNNSPGSTPLMTPSLAGDVGQPSYFNLNSEPPLSREPSRRTSGHRSDSGGSEALNAMFTSFSLNEHPSSIASRRSMHEDSAPLNDFGTSPDLHPLKPITSNTQHTPPANTMMPPPMALFDPEDSTRRFVGTPDYLAPETINGSGQDETSDWWSLGCILFEFLFGYPPFNADSPDAVFDNILNRRIHWPDDDDVPTSAEVKDLINALIALSPKDRLGANVNDKYTSGGEEIRKHVWFAGLNWDTLLEEEPQFIPAPENPEDTEYFDARGATLQSFAEEIEDQVSPGAALGSGSLDYAERPHDALNRARPQVIAGKRGLMPLHIPAHVRDGRNRRLSEPVSGDDFGTFSFKNLPVLEKANMDVIQKLKAEAMNSQSKNHSSLNSPSSPAGGPSLESSPIFPTLKRNISVSKQNIRPASPSAASQTNSSPSKHSQPSSPLLVQTSSGPNGEKRKTSSGSSSLSHQSNNSLQPGSFFDIPRGPLHIKTISNTSSPVKTLKSPGLIPPSPQKLSVGRASSGSRTRSQTVGSQDGETPIKDIFASKRRSGIFDMSPSSSDNEDARANALLRVQRRRQSARRMSQINFSDGPVFRALDVLICEDHPVSRMVMDKLLEKLRCRTICAQDGTEAMRYAMSEVKFDIILMEIKLPQINGTDVARMIRDTKNANSQTPIVAVTGYLKEMTDPHHFDELIEKPATTSKLEAILAKLCMWKPSPSGSSVLALQQLSAMPPSGLRQESVRSSDDSPISVSSGYARMPGSTFRGSSREDSISSSFFGDAESVVGHDDHVVIRQPNDEWLPGGLGISSEADHAVYNKHIQPPHLITQNSAPPKMLTPSPPQQPRLKTNDRLRAVESRRQESADLGDDEDEELGDVQVRAKSPQRKINRNSKLGTEMMRTNSRGSVISASDVPIPENAEPAFSTHSSIAEAPAEELVKIAPLTPPEVFEKKPGEVVREIDMDATPMPTPRVEIDEVTPTPSRYASVAVDTDEKTPRPSFNPTVPRLED